MSDGKLKILAIIPARGGSKEIKLKNLQKVGRFPLIGHTILAAKNSNVNRIIVSTDSQKIADVSRKFGAEIPFLRPKKFAKDSSSTLDVVNHTIQHLRKKENYIPDIITVLLPTSPFRSSKIIDQSINLLRKSNSTSVVSVSKSKEHAYKAFVEKNGFLKPLKKDFRKYYQRQLLPDTFHTTGSVYTFWYNTLKKYGHYYGPKMKPLIIKESIYNIDIDEIFDLFIAEMANKYWFTFLKNFDKK